MAAWNAFKTKLHQVDRNAAPAAPNFRACVAAEAIIGAWGGAALNTGVLPKLDKIAEVLDVHDALILASRGSVLGGHVGWKLGFKNHPALRDGKTAPPALYAPIFEACVVQSGAVISLEKHRVFAAEAEVCFTMGRDLLPRNRPYTEHEVWDAVATVSTSIELCGSRFADPQDCETRPLLADVMMHALVVCGPKMTFKGRQRGPPVLLNAANVTLSVDGAKIAKGDTTENPLDSPLASLTFLANHLAARKRTLKAGHIVIAGHCCQVAFPGRAAPASALALPQAPHMPANGKIELVANFHGLGECRVWLSE